jgi:hypothetical protein
VIGKPPKAFREWELGLNRERIGVVVTLGTYSLCFSHGSLRPCRIASLGGNRLQIHYHVQVNVHQFGFCKMPAVDGMLYQA